MLPKLSNEPKSTDSDSLDLGKVIGEIIDNRKLVISSILLFTTLAILYVLFATPVYKTDALVQIEQKQGNAILNSLSQVLPDGQLQSAPEISLIQSRMILGKTVDDLNLQAIVSQNYFPFIGKGWARLTGEEPENISISKIWMPVKIFDKKDSDDLNKFKVTIIDAKKYSISGEGIGEQVGTLGELIEQNNLNLIIDKIDAKPGTTFTVKYVTKLEAISNLQEILSVSDQGKDTGMLSLSIIGTDPFKITEILNDISQNYVAQNIERQAAQDAKSLDFLNKQLPIVRNDLDQAEDKLNSYRRQKDSVDLSLEAKSVLDQIVNVDNQLNELTFREAEISQLYTKEHPTYKALNEKRATLEHEKIKLNKKVSTMPATQQEVLRLSRDVESGRAVYMQLLNRQQELNIAKSSAIGNVRIIDDAQTEDDPVKPKKALIIILGFIFGAGLAISLITLKTLLRRGIESPEQLEELGINVYASIPTSDWLQKKTLKSPNKDKKDYSGYLALENPADIAIEAIRSLRTSLHFAMMEAKNNVIMISGASPNAGKTFISSNLVAIIAQTGKKVLLIDGDMRKGYMHHLFGLSKDNGLSDILSGKQNVEDVVQSLPVANFDFLPRGKIPPNPAELLMHERFEKLIEWANSTYDIVLIDTPPILAVTDAAIIGRTVGTTMLVARFEVNTPKEIEVSVRRFEQNGVNVKGCILNAVVKKTSGYYSYGYDHYGYSYDDEEKNNKK
ncbi:TPA: polysaccharide biosynthesis tyrosine autokinase [Klebsiella aerogenes]|uniref:polysaccharide biosynthesis tyrosine autokinase n=1 Tax=Klebsiella aerogenes TaxID=548 RepID=UPI00063CC31F|nr:polysaccharide biosynthesis tyrosine autokinase [Klebsiella aerogenes]KLE50917.1 tyrosine protein kinase [Klebsiella aerogenes]MEB7619755.1 polysaccharide biosynthesis tyrosine autokinase [Klebsiella aerogenes]HBT3294500.1 polysaccharide biosynthesis tyrosine autokinase [Klebsiella aerogenes]HDT0389497.1 polysaccharide biosynthesis tyrosine autokinase [Klebsiella aerogenes]